MALSKGRMKQNIQSTLIYKYAKLKKKKLYKSYCSTVHFRRITSIYQPTNAHIISHKTHLCHHPFYTIKEYYEHNEDTLT